MAVSEKISEYQTLSKNYLNAAELLFEKNNLEPALFNAIHALELSIKSALYTVSDEDITIHRVGGLFGRHLLDQRLERIFVKGLTRFFQSITFRDILLRIK